MKKLSAIILCLFVLVISFSSVQAQNRKAVTAAEVNGTFRAKNGSEFKILALGRNRLRISFSGIYLFDSPHGRMANTGEASGVAEIEGDTAVFVPADTEDCTITLVFLRPGHLKVTQEGDSGACGFGVNVNSEGLYRKVSSVKPKF